MTLFNKYQQNNKVVTIDFIDKKADVYDIEVADNHNFSLDCEVFVHNSKDASDAVCGAMYNASQHAEEFAYDYGESAEDLLRFNGDAEHSDKQQLTLDLELELQRMYQARSGLGKVVHPSDADTGTKNYTLYDDFIIM